MRVLLIAIILFPHIMMGQKKEKILFVGNSFTFYWNLPSQVEKMGEEQNIYWEVTQSTAGGATLKDHWHSNKGLKTQEILSQTTFDRIIFQDQSTYPIKFIDTTEQYLSKFKALIPIQTKVYLYATWMYPNFPIEGEFSNDSIGIESNLETILKQFPEIEIIPVGRAFDFFSSLYPEINLLTDDAKHPSHNGTYLAACVIYSTLSRQSSKGLERRYEGKDSNDKKIYYSIVEKTVATRCQAIADQIVFYN